MNVRDFVNRHSTILTIVTSVLLVAALGFLLVRIISLAGGSQEKERIVMAYFYDQNTSELFAAPASTIGPIPTDSGPYNGEPAGVRAVVCACGQCGDESKRFIAYLSKPLPPEEQPPDSEPLELIKRVEDTQWYRSDTPEALKILQEMAAHCPQGVRRNVCLPNPE